MASVKKIGGILISALLVALLAPLAIASPPGIGSQLYTVIATSAASCNGKPCIWADSGSGKIKFRSAAGIDRVVGEADLITNAASDPGGPVPGQCYYNTSTGKIRCYQGTSWLNWGDTGSAAGETFFSRTCTLMSAAAVTPVVCLTDVDVPPAKSAYLLGWHAKVNGSTAWATTASCTIQDSSSTGFAQIAVAALTGNAFVGDLTANVTLLSAYSLNLGGMADLGLQVICNANGTGSNLVFTLYGVIK